MTQLSAKELSGLQELLSGEELLIKKFKMLADATTDSDLKQQFTSIAAKHQTHFNRLYSELN